MKFNCTMISVADINSARKFYEDVFGLELFQNNGSNVLFTCGLSLQQEFEGLVGLPTEKVIKKSNNIELCFEEENFDDFLEKLQEYPHIEYLEEVIDYNWGQRLVRFYDLDGHIVEVRETIKLDINRFYDSNMSMNEVSVKMESYVEDLEKLLNNLE